MPWTKTDYPPSMKNLEEKVRLKAIDIANAMVVDGYDESRAIPIAINQAKEWAKDATKKEVSELKKKDITDHEKSENNSVHLQEADVIVQYDHEENVWQVISKGAKKADSIHDTKKSAQIRAKEIADKRNSKRIIKNKKDTK